MAETTSTVEQMVSRLTEQFECELLSYNPTHYSSVRPGPQRHLFPAGPYALDLCHPDEEIHLICLTDNSSNTFWEYIAEKLDREDLPKHDCVISGLGEQTTVWLHYCSIPPYFDLATVGPYGFPKYPESTYMPLTVRQNLARLQDTWHLLDRLGKDLDTFRGDYHQLRRWAEAAGIFSKVFGTLDAESLVWMLFNAKSLNVPSNVGRQSTYPKGIQSFVDHHSIHDILTPSGRKAYAPPPHIATNGQATIESEIIQLSQNPDSISFSTEQHYQNFCDSYQTLLLVSAEFWATERQRDTFHSQLINQITHLPERFHDIRLDPQDLRFWPHAFKPSEDEWLYIIGVNRRRPAMLPDSEAALQSSIPITQLDLDNTLGIATLTTISKQEALSLPSKHTPPPPSPSQYCTTCHSPPAPPPTSNPQQPQTPPFPLPKKPFPPASQVLSRLRWDPAHRNFDYEVGYLDRFEGLMWLPLEQWGRETEEEDFIPEHRIRVFRRVGGGVRGEKGRVVVWEREGRECWLD